MSSPPSTVEQEVIHPPDGEKTQEKSTTKEKNKTRRVYIGDYEGYDEELIIKEYTTCLQTKEIDIKKAKNPNREEMLKIALMLDEGKLEFNETPGWENGRIELITPDEVSKDIISNVCEKIYSNEGGVINKEIAYKIFSMVNFKNEFEELKGCIATIIGKSLYVYDWVRGQDSNTGEKKFIMTWVPIDVDTRIKDWKDREWLTTKKWQNYDDENKRIFRGHQTSLTISHYWIMLRGIDKKEKIAIYKKIPNSFTPINSTIIKLRNPNINENRYDVVTQYQCRVTTKEEDVFITTVNDNKTKVTPYNDITEKTEQIEKTIGSKYNAAKRDKEAEFLLDTSIVDKIVRNRLESSHSYMVDARIKDDHYMEFDKIFKILAKNMEPTKEVIEILQNLANTNRTYHLLAFLSNANIWFRLGYNKRNGSSIQKDDIFQWLPLSYKYSAINNARKVPQFTDIENEHVEQICMRITGTSSFSIRPRYFAIGSKSSLGYRIINGQIFDIYTYNKPEDEDITLDDNMEKEFSLQRSFQELLELTSLIPKKQKTQQKTNKSITNGKQQKTKKPKEQDNIISIEVDEISSADTTEELSNSISDHNNHNDEITEISETVETTDPSYTETESDSDSIAQKENEKSQTESTWNTSTESSELINNKDNADADSIDKYIETEQIKENIDVENNKVVEMLSQVIKEEIYTTIIIHKTSESRTNNKQHDVPVKYSEIFVSSKMNKRQNKTPTSMQMPLVTIQNVEHNPRIMNYDNQTNKGYNEVYYSYEPKNTNNTSTQYCNANKVFSKRNHNPQAEIKNNITNKKQKKANNKNEICVKPIERKQKASSAKKAKPKAKNSKDKTAIKDQENKTENIGSCEFLIPTNTIPKSITQKKIEIIQQSVKNVKDTVKSRMAFWLSIGGFIQSSVPNVPNKTTKEISLSAKLNKVQRLFGKGNIGKAYEMFTDGVKDPIIPKKKELDKLYPQRIQEMPKIKKGSAPFIVTDEQIEMSLKTLYNGRGAGLSGIKTEHIKQLVKDEKLMKLLRASVQSLINNPQQAQDQIFASRLICIEKNNGNGIRPLCVEEIILKITNKIINAALIPLVIANIDPAQTCLTGNNAQLNAVEQLNTHIKSKKKIYITQIDMTNAFGSIEHKTIIEQLQQIKTPDTIVHYIATLLNRMQIVYYGNNNNEIISRRIMRGVPQGDPISMTLFALAIDKVISNTKQSLPENDSLDVIGYADDVIIITSTKDEMRRAIKTFKREANNIGLTMNKEKTKKYTNKEDDDGEYKSLYKQAIEYLGIFISLDDKITQERINDYLEEIYISSKNLWTCKGLSLQAKYYMFQTCIISKVVYVFRGTEIKSNVKEISDKIEALYKNIIPIPIEILRLPVTIGGMGLSYLEDLRQISRTAFLIELGKKDIPTTIKEYFTEKEDYGDGEMQHLISKAYYKKKRQQYIMNNKNKERYIIEMLSDNQETSAHTLLSSLPTNQTQIFTDMEFKLLIALRYRVDITSHARIKCHACGKENASLWHLLRCHKVQRKSMVYVHERLKCLIGNIISKNKNIISIKYETYSNKQRQQNNLSHIPDIVISDINGNEHILDITVETKYKEKEGAGNEPKNGMTRKRIEYKMDDGDLHPIVFDNSGRINSKSWEYLHGLGVKRGQLKYMQCIIMKANAYALGTLTKEQKNKNNKEMAKKNKQQINESILT